MGYRKKESSVEIYQWSGSSSAVERQLPKLKVAGSSPVYRSKNFFKETSAMSPGSKQVRKYSPFYYLGEPLRLERFILSEKLSASPSSDIGYPLLKIRYENLSTSEALATLSSELEIPLSNLEVKGSYQQVGRELWPLNFKEPLYQLSEEINQYLLVKTESPKVRSLLKGIDSTYVNRIYINYVGSHPKLTPPVTSYKLRLKFYLEDNSLKGKLLRVSESFSKYLFLNLYGHSEYLTSWLPLAPKILRGMRLEINEEYLVREMMRGLRGTPWEGLVKRKDRFGAVLSRLSKNLMTYVFPAFRNWLWNSMVTRYLEARSKLKPFKVDYQGLTIFEIRRPLLKKVLISAELPKILDLPSPLASYDEDMWRVLASILRKLSLDLSYLSQKLEGKPIFSPGRRKTFFSVRNLLINIQSSEAIIDAELPVWSDPESFISGIRALLINL